MEALSAPPALSAQSNRIKTFTPSSYTHSPHHPSLALSPHRQHAGKQEIIHTASHTGVGVLYQPVRSIACLLSPAIEVIHRTIILQLIVQGNIPASPAPPPPPPPLHRNPNFGKLPTRLKSQL